MVRQWRALSARKALLKLTLERHRFRWTVKEPVAAWQPAAQAGMAPLDEEALASYADRINSLLAPERKKPARLDRATLDQLIQPHWELGSHLLVASPFVDDQGHHRPLVCDMDGIYWHRGQADVSAISCSPGQLRQVERLQQAGLARRQVEAEKIIYFPTDELDPYREGAQLITGTHHVQRIHAQEPFVNWQGSPAIAAEIRVASRHFPWAQDPGARSRPFFEVFWIVLVQSDDGDWELATYQHLLRKSADQTP